MDPMGQLSNVVEGVFKAWRCQDLWPRRHMCFNQNRDDFSITSWTILTRAQYQDPEIIEGSSVYSVYNIAVISYIYISYSICNQYAYMKTYTKHICHKHDYMYI